MLVVLRSTLLFVTVLMLVVLRSTWLFVTAGLIEYWAKLNVQSYPLFSLSSLLPAILFPNHMGCEGGEKEDVKKTREKEIMACAWQRHGRRRSLYYCKLLCSNTEPTCEMNISQ
jgi:hypothetical protein